MYKSINLISSITKNLAIPMRGRNHIEACTYIYKHRKRGAKFSVDKLISNWCTDTKSFTTADRYIKNLKIESSLILSSIVCAMQTEIVDLSNLRLNKQEVVYDFIICSSRDIDILSFYTDVYTLTGTKPSLTEEEVKSLIYINRERDRATYARLLSYVSRQGLFLPYISRGVLSYRWSEPDLRLLFQPSLSTLNFYRFLYLIKKIPLATYPYRKKILEGLY